jgi:hypothetical protein
MSYGLSVNNEGNYYTLHDGVQYPLDKPILNNNPDVIFHSQLRFDNHTDGKSNKANSVLGVIKNTTYLTPDVLENIYKSVVRPHIEYAYNTWFPHRLMEVEKIEKVYNHAHNQTFT